MRTKQKECTNCHGTNEKCHYLETGRKCRKGQAKGKAKGKAISQATLDKRDNYDSQIGDLHTDYINYMENKRITTILVEETGEIKTLYRKTKIYSFERWLNLNGYKKQASWLRRNVKDLERLNYHD